MSTPPRGFSTLGAGVIHSLQCAEQPPAGSLDALDILARARHKYPFDKIVSHKLPLDQINEVMAARAQAHITRASLVP